MNVAPSDFNSITRWMVRNARPLDLARWQFHFEGGSQAAVLAALAAYQNDDGGFGHALEPDSWNPNSSPYTTSIAIHLLEEIGFRDRQHAIVQKIAAYLAATSDFDGERWPAVISTNADYPHAPWWADASYDWGYTPTALLAGFIVAYAGQEASIYQKALKIAGAAVDRYLHGTMPDGAPYNTVRREGEIGGIDKMLSFLEAAGVRPGHDIAEVRRVMNRQAQTFIEKDASKWTQYCWKPSNFVRSPDSIFYPGNEEAIQVELDYILGKRNAEGIWDITWTWGAYDAEFAISRNWWQANLIIENLRLLRAFGRL
jgi:hypothetical protein